MATSTISKLWLNPGAPRQYRTGVSLHSHTSESRETLSSLAKFGNQYWFMRPLMKRLERRSAANHGMPVNYAAGFWTPPLPPRRAYDLETGQITALDLAPIVSLSDHDNLNAPMLLRNLPSAATIPLSVEWTAPFGEQAFHLGVHNLPPAGAAAWMQILAEYTRNPDEERLAEILAALHAEPDVLIVFNHPRWDLYLIGKDRHAWLLNDFLHRFGRWLHALELNGLRSAHENQGVRELSAHWRIPLISGGDRHGLEPNATLNLTNAATFQEFVQEIRVDKRSNVLFMPQYAEPLRCRMLRSAVDAIRYYPDFPEGARRWDERVFHPDAEGNLRCLRELWPDGTAPAAMSAALGLVRMMGHRSVSRGLRLTWGRAWNGASSSGDWSHVEEISVGEQEGSMQP